MSEKQDNIQATQMDGDFVIYNRENGDEWISAGKTVELPQ